MPDKQIRFSLNNSLTELDTLSSHLESAGNQWQLNPRVVLQLNLALDELFTNVVSYGFGNNSDDSTQQIDLILDLCGDEIRVTMVDGGRPFDPTKPADPDLDLSIKDAKIGGLGIFLARQYVDQLHYRRTDAKNIITLVKKTS